MVADRADEVIGQVRAQARVMAGAGPRAGVTAISTLHTVATAKVESASQVLR